jgi:putative glutamine amidotransferase
MDHREDKDAPYAVQYAPAHEIRIEADSAMAQWAGGITARVNSLHGQGVGRLARGLRAIAHAPDGLIEAFEVQDTPAFAYAVQWHPEWRTAENPFYTAIFQAFGDACRVRQRSRWEQ